MRLGILTALLVGAFLLPLEGQAYHDIVFNRLGQPMAGASVAVCSSNPGSATPPCTSTLVQTYTTETGSVGCTLSATTATDTSGSGCTMPGVTDAYGNYTLYIPTSGLYWVQIYGPTITTNVIPIVIPTTADSFLGPVFNIKAYGATGNGTTDDTASINAAITAAAVSGGLVVVPVGTFIVSSQIAIPNTVAMTGLHSTKSLIKAKSTFPVSTPVVRIGTGSGVNVTGSAVRNLKIDCNSVVGCEGIYTTEANELSDIEKVTVTNYMAYGIHLLGSANGPGQFAIRDPYLLSSASATNAIGIYLDTTGGNLIMVEHGTCDNNGGIQQSACIKTNGSTQLAVHDMHVEDVADGVYFAAGSAGQADGIVGHNSVTNTVTVATTGEVALLDINKNAGTNTINDTNKSILITENRVGFYAVGHTNANLLTTATQINRLFGLTVNNGSDATQTARFSGGSAASQIVDITLQDIGSDKWKIEKDASNLFRIRDTAASDNTRLSFTTAGVSNFSAGGTSAVCLQCNTNAGTGGVQIDGGGASPVQVAAVDGSGNASFASTTNSGALLWNSQPVFVYVTGDFTTAANTSLQAITGLAWTMPGSLAINVPFDCYFQYSQATAAVADSFGIQDVTTAPTQINANGTMQTNTTAFSSGPGVVALASTTATAVMTATPSAITTVWSAEMHGVIEQPSGTASAINIMVKTATAADAVTVKRGSYCRVGPK